MARAGAIAYSRRKKTEEQRDAEAAAARKKSLSKMVVSHDPVEREAAAKAVAALENIGKASATTTAKATEAAPPAEKQGPPEAPPAARQPDAVVTASPLPTLMEQLLGRQQDILNAPAAEAPPPPRELSVGERLNLAFAGLDPQFRRDVVQPEIDKRRGFVPAQQEFARQQAEAEQAKIQKALPLAAEEQRQIDAAKADAAQTEAFKQAFTNIAQDYFSVAEQVQEVAGVLEQTGEASNVLRGRDLLRRAATVQQVLQNADSGQPVNDDVLNYAQSELKELQAATAVAMTGLAQQESQRRTQASILQRMLGSRQLPSTNDIRQRSELKSAQRAISTISKLTSSGYGGGFQQVPASWMAYLPVASQTEFVQNNLALRAAMSDLSTLLLPDRLGANIPAGERDFAIGILVDPKSSVEAVKAAIQRVEPFIGDFLNAIESRFMFGDSITGPSPGLPDGAVEVTGIDDNALINFYAQQGAQ